MATNNAVNNGLSGATGTGSFVGSNSPSLVTPALGTPSSGNLANCTGYPFTLPSGVMFNRQQTVISYAINFAPAAATWTDTTISVTITPTSASNKVSLRANINGMMQNNSDYYMFRLVRNSTPIGVGDAAGSRTQATTYIYGNVASDPVALSVILEFDDTPATTSAITYKVQAYAQSASAFYINYTRIDTNTAAYPRTISTFTASEIQA